jgi:hypothetical protein
LGGDGRALRRRALRAHLRACGDCRDYRSAIAERQSRVAALAPAMPSAAAMRLLDSVFASAGGGFGGAGLFTGFGVPAALKSLTALALVAASTAGVLQVVEPGTGRGPAGEERAAPVVAPSGPAAPARSTHRARSSARAHGGHGTAPRGRADAERARAPYADAAPPRESSVVTHGSPVAGPAVTPDAAPSGREAPPRHHGGRVRNLVSGTADSDPVQHAVSVITHPNVPSAPEVRVTLPVKVPTAPPHPKRKHAKHLA